MQLVHEEREGVTNGSHPLLIQVPYFAIKTITQLTPGQDMMNTLTITIQSPFPLSEGSRIILSGLQGAIAADGDLPVKNVPAAVTNCSAPLGSCADKFSSSAELTDEGFGYWNNSQKTLTLWVRNSTLAGELIALAFNVTNPAQGQVPPRIEIAAEIEYGVHDSSISPTAMNGIEGESDAMRVGAFQVAKCGQSNASALALNTLTL
ncbi:MAG: hypothetical protein ACPIOQ_50550, partial [Promethearchaeia archaeon]